MGCKELLNASDLDWFAFPFFGCVFLFFIDKFMNAPSGF